MDFRNRRTLGLIIGLVVLLVACGACFFLGRGALGGLSGLFGGGGEGGLLGGGDQPGELGRMYAALEIDQDGCPLQTTDQFYSGETIYAGAEESFIPRGTTVFMRLYYEGEPIEDTDEIQADQDLNTCIWFEFTPGPAGFEPGQYQAELIVNGNRADAINFEVLPGSAETGGLPATGLEGVQLGQVVTAAEVDLDGCPAGAQQVFFSGEPVYLGVTESVIPAGTEIFANLLQDGQVVETTEPVVAEQDLQTCVWFVFEGTGSSAGLDPGDYTVELYVNGARMDSVIFSVQ
jgi:hypothetical protein